MLKLIMNLIKLIVVRNFSNTLMVWKITFNKVYIGTLLIALTYRYNLTK